MDETACTSSDNNDDVPDNDVIQSDTEVSGNIFMTNEHPKQLISQQGQQHHHGQQQQIPSSPSMPLSIHSSPIMAHAVRLTPGSDFVSSLEEIINKIAVELWKDNNCDNMKSNILKSHPPPFACFIMTAVGSLSHCTLRMASAPILNLKQKNHDKKQQLCNDNNNWNQDIRSWEENVEIISLVGTIGLSMKDKEKMKLSSTSNDNNNAVMVDNDNRTGWEMTKHLHMSISDGNGICYGGHFIRGTVFTTVEIVLGTMMNGIRFNRVHDPNTGYKELMVSK